MVQRAVRKKVKVPLYGQPAGRVANIEDGATHGAMIGRDLYFEDGTIATLEALRAALATSTSSSSRSSLGNLSPTIWRLIREVPIYTTGTVSPTWEYTLDGSPIGNVGFAAANDGIITDSLAGDLVLAPASGRVITDSSVVVFDKDLTVGHTAQINPTAGRGNITVNGDSAAIYQLAIAGTRVAYLFHDGTDFTLDNVEAGDLIFATQGVGRLFIFGDGSEIQLDATLFDFNGTMELSGNLTMAQEFRAVGSDVIVTLIQNTAATNEKVWWWRASGGQFLLQTRTDAEGAGATPIAVDRTGTTVDVITLTGALLSFNGLPVMSAADIGLQLHDTTGTSSNMAAYVAFYDAGAIQRGWMGYGEGNTRLQINNTLGAIYLNSNAADLHIDTIFRFYNTSETRLVHDSAFLSGYDSTESTRRGYLQFSTGGPITLQSEESGQNINLRMVSGGVNIVDDNVGTILQASATQSVWDHGSSGVVFWIAGQTRLLADNGFMAFYNAAQSARTGYIQWNVGTGGVLFHSELSANPLYLITDGGQFGVSTDDGSSLAFAIDSAGQVRVQDITGGILFAVQADDSGPWGISLERTDLGTNSKVFANDPSDGGGIAWVFEHQPIWYNSGAYSRLATVDEAGTSGTYTPTVIVGGAAVTVYEAQYIRVGDIVTVSGKVDYNASSTGSVTWTLSVPVATTFANVTELAGTVNSLFAPGFVRGNTSNDGATFESSVSATGSRAYWYTYTYQVI